MFDLYANERTLVLIDGQNLRGTLKALSIEIDYKQMLHFFRTSSRLVRALYFTTVAADEFQPLRPLIDWLEYNGFTMVTRAVKPVYDEQGVARVRGDARVELAVTAMELADQVDHVILFTGHTSYCSLVAALKRRGRRVTVISSLEARPSGVADELRRAADQFVELLDLTPILLERKSSSESRGHQVEETVECASPDDVLAAGQVAATPVASADATKAKAPAAKEAAPEPEPAVSRARNVVERKRRAKKTDAPD